MTPNPSSAHPADSHDQIKVFGAKENNLKNLNLVLPKRRLTVFTGVSGSGKSSLVFDTIAAESQRMINETYSAFVQGFMPNLSRPDVEQLEGLTPAILIDQERLGANSRSTVGTATDAYSMLRVLFSRLGEPFIGSPQAFSFNVASAQGSGAVTVAKGNNAKAVRQSFSVTGGMCPKCEGMGTVNDIDLSQLYDETKSLSEGALTVPGYTKDGWMVKIFSASGFLDPNKKIQDYTKRELDDFLYKAPTKISFESMNMTYEGLIPRIQKSFLAKDKEAMQSHIRAFVDRAVTFSVCPECEGTRLNELARSSKIQGKNIAEVSAMAITELAEWLRALESPKVKPLLESLQETLDSFVQIGLGYLSLDRSSGTLSGGEAQRTKMIRHLNSALSDVSYIFDEPSIGLHPHDLKRMSELILKLRDKGNTVLVVEHKAELISLADHIVDIGPGAGKSGGEIVYQGDYSGLLESGTITGKFLTEAVTLKQKTRTASDWFEIKNASTHNLKDVSVNIPLGILTVVTGVAGSGKSSLIHGSLSGQPGVTTIDQTAIKGSRRSNSATYTGLLDLIRKEFAKANGVKAALFSSNSEGACPNCNGSGVIYTDLSMLATVANVCEVCAGKGFEASVLDYKLGGLDISEVLDFSVNQAQKFFSKTVPISSAQVILDRLNKVGLGYLSLAQQLSTLSGGERQRLKLAASLNEKSDIFVLDEPTSGLHLADVKKMIELFDDLIRSKKSVIVIEHHLAVVAQADWVIDLGPGAGKSGGEIVFEGTPQQLIQEKSSLTGEYLARYISE